MPPKHCSSHRRRVARPVRRVHAPRCRGVRAGASPARAPRPQPRPLVASPLLRGLQGYGGQLQAPLPQSLAGLCPPCDVPVRGPSFLLCTCQVAPSARLAKDAAFTALLRGSATCVLVTGHTPARPPLARVVACSPPGTSLCDTPHCIRANAMLVSPGPHIQMVTARCQRGGTALPTHWGAYLHPQLARLKIRCPYANSFHIGCVCIRQERGWHHNAPSEHSFRERHRATRVRCSAAQSRRSSAHRPEVGVIADSL